MNDLRLRKDPYGEVAFQGVPIFRCQAWALIDAYIHGSRFVVTSGDRRAGVAERYGKMSQARLYWCAEQKKLHGSCPPICHGNCFPANPPGHSSHELRGDGVVATNGAHMHRWQLGIDANDDGKVNDCSGLVTKLRHCGYGAYRPYNTASEGHHLNFLSDPTGNARHRLYRYAARHPLRWRQLMKQFG